MSDNFKTLDTKEVKKEEVITDGELRKIKETLDIRAKRLEIISKIKEIRRTDLKSEFEAKKDQFALKRAKDGEDGYHGPIDKLLNIARAWCINNDKTVMGSEPYLESLWTSEEMEEIKYLILKKARQL